MGSFALPVSNIGTVVTIATDTTTPARWSVHAGVAPAQVQPPFVAVFDMPWANISRGQASEDWGKWQARYQLSCFGKTPDQAVWLARQVIGAAWPDGWEIEPDVELVHDPDPSPTWWFMRVIAKANTQ